MKSVYLSTVLLGLAIATASSVGCSSGGAPKSSEDTGTVSAKLSFYAWQNQVDRQNFPVIKYTLSNSSTGFSVSGSTNSTETDEIEGKISGIPVGPGYSLSLTATSSDGAWTCSGATTRTFKEICSDNDEDDELRVNLLCQNRWVRSWHRVPVIGEFNVICAKDAGADASDSGKEAEACVPVTSCPTGTNCGTISNGCGGTVTCGPAACTGLDQTCGGGGVANQCGCTPKTCSQLGASCGTVADNGCGGTIASCGTCPAGQACNGSNKCVCAPLTACPAADNCGTIADTCGGTVTCGNMQGNCAAGLSCVSNVCKCVPKTASQVCGTAVCGTAPDGCGGTVSCGTCTGATPVCSSTGSCIPAGCQTACPSGDNCGTISQPGCPVPVLTCGTCPSTPANESCGGGSPGAPNVCGCTPTAKATACGTAACGTAPDGCGGTITCGTCGANQTCDSSGTCRPNGCLTACPAGECGTISQPGCAIPTLTCSTTCTSPNTCGAVAPNQCGCNKLTACTGGQQCGTQPDGCGGTVTCGTCSGATPVCDSTTNSCIPAGCLTACPSGDNCGTISQPGCPVPTLNCGSCSSPQSCGAGNPGKPNVCGCQDATSCTGSQQCGTQTDSCGNPVSCGTCSGSTPVCDATGTCRPAGCLTACPAADNCGVINQPGCAIPQLNCGTCPTTPANESCGGGNPGTANVCGCTPTPKATACGTAVCGTAPDGCGGTIICGTCGAGQTCDGTTGTCQTCATTCPAGDTCGSITNPAGCPNPTVSCGTCTHPNDVCSSNVCKCTPSSAAVACGSQTCGTAPDGCGGTVSCGPLNGACQAGFTCSAAGTCVCQPLTACPAGDNCGTIPNGCGGTVTCSPNSCTGTGATCGGGGTANQCGCTPKTQAAACGSNNCGSVADGCGGTIVCGTCAAGSSCSIPSGSTAGTCASSCKPITCASLPAGSCGTFSDGCTSTITCGCATGFSCGGGGTPGQCGSACSMNNNGAGCTATEQKFVDKSVDCYSCLVNFSCLDDQLFGDTNNECEDVAGVSAATSGMPGVSNTSLCLQKIDCVMSSKCASTDIATCYCGTFAGSACATQSLPGNGSCAALEADGVDHLPTDSASVVSPLLGNRNTAAGKSDAIFACSILNGCGPLCNQ